MCQRIRGGPAGILNLIQKNYTIKFITLINSRRKGQREIAHRLSKKETLFSIHS